MWLLRNLETATKKQRCKSRVCFSVCVCSYVTVFVWKLVSLFANTARTFWVVRTVFFLPGSIKFLRITVKVHIRLRVSVRDEVRLSVDIKVMVRLERLYCFKELPSQLHRDIEVRVVLLYTHISTHSYKPWHNVVKGIEISPKKWKFKTSLMPESNVENKVDLYI